MPILKVLNVKQGDSIILMPPNGCKFADMTFYVDLGPGQYDVTEQISKKDKVHIIITHHDADHLNGIKFFVDKMHQVEKITVPFHQNEITLIAKSILSLKGMSSAQDCGEFIRLLDDIVSNQIYIKKITQNKSGPTLCFAYEGVNFDGCKHITCLNPPLIMDTVNWLGEISPHVLSDIFFEVFDTPFAQIMDTYISEMRRGRPLIYYEDEPDITKEIRAITLDDSKTVPFDGENGIIYTSKGSYVVNFILRNIELFRAFNTNPTRKKLRVIYDKFTQCAHDACIVLKAEYCGKTFLLTGDASKNVFNRLICDNTDISADYLKVPHHGSINNLDENILKNISPSVAIISHDNHRFGKATDSHPNMEVLELLGRYNIQIMLTNSVSKSVCGIKKELMNKNDFLGDDLVEIL